MKFNQINQSVLISKNEWIGIGSKMGWTQTSATKKKDALIQYKRELQQLQWIIEEATKSGIGSEFVNEVSKKFLEYIDEKYMSDDYKMEFSPSLDDEEGRNEERSSFIDSVIMPVLNNPNASIEEFSRSIRQRFMAFRSKQLKIRDLVGSLEEAVSKSPGVVPGAAPKNVTQVKPVVKDDPLSAEEQYAKEQLAKKKLKYKDVTQGNVLVNQTSEEAKVVEQICNSKANSATGIPFVMLVGIDLHSYIDSKYNDPNYKWKTSLQEERKGVADIIESINKELEVNPQLEKKQDKEEPKSQDEVENLAEPIESTEAVVEEPSTEPLDMPLETVEPVSAPLPELTPEETLNDRITKLLVTKYKDFLYSQLARYFR